METVKFDSKASWTIATACLLLNFLILIPTKVSGLFFVEILDRYQVSRNLAGYPAFTITLLRCSGGPFAGYFAERFGINLVMLLGSLLAAVGISACFFAEDIAAVTVFLGLIHGIGVASTNTFYPQITRIHFRKHLTVAFGLTQAGACLGSFCSSPLLLWIFRSYGTSGGFLVIGAIILNGLPIVLILNLLSPNKLYNKSRNSMKSKKCQEIHLEMRVTATVNSSEGEDNITNNVRENKERDVKTREGTTDSEIRNSLKNKATSALVLNRPVYDHTDIMPEKTDGLAISPSSELNACNLSMKESGLETRKDRMEFEFIECGKILELKPKNSIHEGSVKVAIDDKINEIEQDFKKRTIPVKLMTNYCEEKLSHSNNCSHSKTEYKFKSDINNKDVLKYQAGEVKDCYLNKESGNNTSFKSMSNVSTNSYLVDQGMSQQQKTLENGENIPSSCDFLKYNKPSNKEMNKKEELRIEKKQATGTTNSKKTFKIFLDVTYWIVIITQSIHVFVLVIFWTTMIDFSRDKNVDRSNEIYLLMVLPVAEMIGRLGLGWISDRKYLTRINFSIFCFIVLSFACSLMAWAQRFYVVMASIFMFGVISGGLITIFPMIIFDFFDSDKHTMGQASRYCLFGPLSFLNGPLIGYFRGTLGSYAWLYHTIAIVSLACAALSSLIPVLARMRDEKKNKAS